MTVAYTFEDGTRFDDLLLVGDSFYWNHNTHTGGQVAPSTIKTRTKAGTSSTILVSGLGLSYDLQVFEEQMVWLERRTDVQTTQIFHVDDKYVYFGAGPNGGTSTLVRVAK